MPDSALDRTRRALTARPSRSHAVVGVLLALLGFAGAVQVSEVRSDEAYAGTRRDDLIQLLQSLSIAQSRAADQLTELEQTRDALQVSSAQRQAALAESQERLDALRLLSGRTAAVGPGVTITIKDPDGTVAAATLLNAVEELRDSGAEAIEVNDAARVVAQTWFADGDDPGDATLVVDSRNVSAPYVVEAIGDPATLVTAVAFPGGLTDEVEALGGTVSIVKSDELQIESLAPERAATFAEPIT
ncbi:DUF881 domain-containing protein [soil metagenome]